MNLIEQQTNCPGEDTKTTCEIPCLDHQENKKDLWKDQVMIA